MSYLGISIREAMEKINSLNNGWYLPQVQRQYVWGARYESETYICLLLDSLLKRYPIGGIVLWETDQRVPYRHFLGDYIPGRYAKQVDEGLWGEAKSLVYDGQQRLQTLYSVLRHRFNGRVLHFDLLFDQNKNEADETGFLFRDAHIAHDPRYLRMTEISSLICKDREKVALEERVLPLAGSCNDTRLLIRQNISGLWNVFVDRNHKSIAYFSVNAETPKEVNEVFRRLNTGGIQLTQLELVLSKIKAVHSDYEEQLCTLADRIEKKSGGIKFSSSSILQFFHLLIKNTIRINEDQLMDDDIKAFQDIINDDQYPLVELFSGYLQGLLNINNASIVPRWLGVLPIAAYLTERKRSGAEWRIRALPEPELQPIHQYFLLSQFCDWNTQTMINAFAREAIAAAKGNNLFPLETIRDIAIQKNRTGDLHEYQLQGQPWLAVKVLMPNRSYVFHENKPQIDHIFPIKLDGKDETYREAVDVLWNFQPMPAEVNNYKRARHPKEFFLSKEGQKYWGSYDFVPETNDTLWDNHLDFIKARKKHMLDKLKSLYGLCLASRATDQDADA